MMATYRFPIEEFYGVMNHVAVYKDMVVTSLTNNGTDYTLEVNIPITPEEVIHLNENYNLVEVA
jgi:hypothetical protein